MAIKDKHLHFVVDEATYDELKHIAAAQSRALGNLCRMILEQWLRIRKPQPEAEKGITDVT